MTGYTLGLFSVPSTSTLVLLVAGAVFLGWFIWYAVVLAKAPYFQSAKDWLDGLGSFGAYFREWDEENEPIVPKDGELTTWHKVQGIGALVSALVCLGIGAHYAIAVIDRLW